MTARAPSAPALPTSVPRRMRPAARGPRGKVTGREVPFRGRSHEGAEVDPLRYGGAAPVPAVGERPVQGDDQSLGAGPAGPFGPLRDLVPATRPVGLEEQLRV